MRQLIRVQVPAWAPQLVRRVPFDPLPRPRAGGCSVFGGRIAAGGAVSSAGQSASFTPRKSGVRVPHRPPPMRGMASVCSGARKSMAYFGRVRDDASFDLRLAQDHRVVPPAGAPIGCLRDPFEALELRPRVLEFDRAAAVHHMAQARAQAVRRFSRPVRDAHDLSGGRLLAYFPRSPSLAMVRRELRNLAASSTSTTHRRADTWIALFRDESADISSQDHLVSWVPERAPGTR